MQTDSQSQQRTALSSTTDWYQTRSNKEAQHINTMQKLVFKEHSSIFHDVPSIVLNINKAEATISVCLFRHASQFSHNSSGCHWNLRRWTSTDLYEPRSPTVTELSTFFNGSSQLKSKLNSFNISLRMGWWWNPHRVHVMVETVPPCLLHPRLFSVWRGNVVCSLSLYSHTWPWPQTCANVFRCFSGTWKHNTS